MTNSIPVLDSRSSGDVRRVKAFTWAAVTLWFLFAAAGSLLGAFDAHGRPPLPLGAAAVGPVVAFAILFSAWPAFRDFVLSANVRVLTAVQTWRAGGFVFLILHARGLLPAAFAYPAGWGDIAVGVTAPLVAWFALSRSRFVRQLFVWWNVFGILDLVLAVTMGAVCGVNGSTVLAPGEVTTRLMGQFPLSLIPTFFVPLFVILHLIALAKARRGQPIVGE